MKRFKNILFFADGSEEMTPALQRAAQMAESNNRVAEQNNNDIIVMGTLGRVGIPGLFIGNTAEEIIQTTKCSVLAVKPTGFISPVQ